MALISAVQGEIAELTRVLNDDSMLKRVSVTSLIKTSVSDGEELTSWKPSWHVDKVPKNQRLHDRPFENMSSLNLKYESNLNVLNC